MRRASPPFHLFAAAAATDSNIAITYSNMPVISLCRCLHILLGRIGRPYSGGRGQFVTGDAHFQSVRDVNSGFRRGESGSFANLTQYQYPPSNPRPSPPYHPKPQFRHPSPYNQAQQVRPRPPDYRDWEYAATPPPPDCERFIILSYNILADYLAIDHRSKLYYHIPHYMMDWQWRKKNIVFELGLWSADIMCLQEVDRFHDLVEELNFRGYDGIWKMRTGNPVDGCAIFWRTSRFNLRCEECIEFNKLGLRDNVAQICVLELKNQSESLASSLTGSNKVVICNIHVLYNPNRGEIKLGQVRVLLDRAKAVSKIWNDAPVVICGDFNCTPKSPLYNFISEQKLNLSGIDRDKVSGQAAAVIRAPRLYGPNSRERSAANGSVQVTSVAGEKEANNEQNSVDSTKDKRQESQYNNTTLDMSAKSSTHVQSENQSGALYDAGKVTQQTAVEISKIIGDVDSTKEESPFDHINNEIHDITSVTSSAIEAAQTDKNGMECTEQILDAVSPSKSKSVSEKFDIDIPDKNKQTEFDSCSTSLGEEIQSFRVKIDPESTELLSEGFSSTEPSSQTSVSDSVKTPHLDYKESSSFKPIADDQVSCTLTSYQDDKSNQSTNIVFPLDEKLEKLYLDEIDKDILQGENIGEDSDSFISALHNEEGSLTSIGTNLGKSDLSEELESASDLPRSLNSRSFDSERTTYNPSLWTPVEIETATGNSECTFLEHSLPLRSTYTEVTDRSGTRDPNGEPLVTSYNRCFLGTVDYIWRSDGLQTIRVLAPIPKHAMEWTPGFPTKKWGSDHIALVSELAFVKSTNISDIQ
ncbi:carbon catabolite repressor protein 4-like protein 6 isoform X1 [Senna tora]|uniref:Carbon catabolite repressor protein 4-like protein 6 isoform X1 n=1 Tax=Senna tora TaxID=362788 RepID=A0A834T8P1_9FABA|nr:carbon catabolite repressor protein 4-like protein 6 isoform X1 [Senna tora]